MVMTIREIMFCIKLRSKFANFLPEDTNTDVTLFLDFGNVWGVDYDIY